ncbi:hypothetical protein KNP414_06194 [Paenibacillus mucilaginosus KNP414]|uniref:Uncharacterized protein n=1 Tax=Paenibacillus mucilaginosus (strain KNP414) TaxID=1036673 RepID=F8FIH4_PAEMK|nr:hypothetical protein KNP414_06194 [Paenibacillus mucilaginosus KNP414]
MNLYNNTLLCIFILSICQVKKTEQGHFRVPLRFFLWPCRLDDNRLPP